MTGWFMRVFMLQDQDAAPPRRKRSWGPMLLVVGALVAIGIALAIGSQRYGQGGAAGTFSLSQANGLCASSFGQYAQITNLRASANCSSIAASEEARGWLLVGGVAGLVAGFAWGALDRRRVP